MFKVHDSLSLFVKKWESWKEDWEYKATMETYEAHSKKEKEIK
jgi:hypothetical protein